MRHDLNTMQNLTRELTELASMSSSITDDIHVTETTDVDECILDPSSLPCETEYALSCTSAREETHLLKSHDYELDTFITDTKRRLQVTDINTKPCVYDSGLSTNPCGYDSDTEQEETTLERKRKKKKNNKYKAYQTHANNLSRGQKRMYDAERSGFQKQKRHRPMTTAEIDHASSSDSNSLSSSSSSSDSTTSSESSCSDNDNCVGVSKMVRKYLKPIRKIIPCPESCVCIAGQSRPPVPIYRSRHPVVEPLYKKLLQRRLLSLANTALYTCCNRHCYLRWARSRISMHRMVRDYHESDLRVHHFSWGNWKPEPESDEESSSEDEWIW